MSAKPGVTARGRRVGRLLALGVLLAGLLAMHTLGHSGGHSADHTPGLLSGALSAADTAAHSRHGGHAVVDADAAAALLTASLPAPAGDLNLVMFCVAVLTMAGLILVLAAVAAPHPEQRLGSASSHVVAVARPPPVRAPLLSQLSILRI